MSIEYKIKLTITGCISAKKEGKMRSLVLLLCFVKKKKNDHTKNLHRDYVF